MYALKPIPRQLLRTEHGQAQNAAPGNAATLYLTFSIGREHLALPASRVREIIEFTSVTRVPLAPLFVRGVMNLRGNLVPVIDLTARFWGQAATPTALACVLVVETLIDSERVTLGVLVDAVRDVIDIPMSQIAAGPGLGAHIPSEFISGMTPMADTTAGSSLSRTLGINHSGGGFLTLLDTDVVLSVAELAALVEQSSAVAA